MGKRVLRWALFTWVRCPSCDGRAYTTGDPYGCWDCRNRGMEPRTRRWVRWPRLYRWAWSKVGPV